MSHDDIAKPNPLEKAVEKALAEKVAQVEPLRQVPNLSELNKDLSAKNAPTLSSAGESSGTIVEIDTEVLARNQIVGHLKSGIGTNVFNLLRSQVLAKLRRHNCRSLAITGPTEGVGKSQVSLNLSLAIAKQKKLEVSLLDLDLRKPSLAHLVNVLPDIGITDFLEGTSTLGEVELKTQFDNISFYLGNDTRQNASELLSNEYANQLLPTLAPNNESLVVVDLPPILGLSDVHTFLPECDAALLVVEYGRTSVEEIEETIRLLGNVPLVGSVVNRGHLSSIDVYGYGYRSEEI